MTADTIWSYDRTNLFTDNELQLEKASCSKRKEVVDGLNAIDKQYMYKLMSTVKLPGSKIFEKYILMHSCTPKKDVSLAE